MKVSLLGTGLMGSPIAERILKAGYELIVYNRTLSKARPFVKKGARLAASPTDAIRSADVVVLVLSDAAAIREMVFSSSRADLSGKAFLQMGTIGPDESKALAVRLKKRGDHYAECPVLGSIAEVKSGKLILMFGGTREQFLCLRKFLKCFGREPYFIGPVGHAATLKLCLNQFIASHMAALTQSLGLIQRTGIDVETFMNVLRQSALYAPMFDKKLPRLLKRDYGNPNFSTLNMLKDVRLFLRAGKRSHLNLKALRGVEELLKQTVSRGFEKTDYCALYETVSPRDRSK